MRALHNVADCDVALPLGSEKGSAGRRAGTPAVSPRARVVYECSKLAVCRWETRLAIRVKDGEGLRVLSKILVAGANEWDGCKGRHGAQCKDEHRRTHGFASRMPDWTSYTWERATLCDGESTYGVAEVSESPHHVEDIYANPLRFMQGVIRSSKFVIDTDIGTEGGKLVRREFSSVVRNY